MNSKHLLLFVLTISVAFNCAEAQSTARHPITKTLYRLNHHQQPTPSRITHSPTSTVLTTPNGGHIRSYFITVEELDWDYAPKQWDHLYGKPLNESMAAIYTVPSLDPPRIGSVYRKAAYRAYTDATFRMRVSHDSVLGTLGPVIRAEVGDEIHVHFRNMASRNYSIHPFGIVSGSSHEPMEDPGVAPEANHIYIWHVPERSGPGPRDPSSLIWSYVSVTDPIRDLHSGLMGPLIVYKRGLLEPLAPFPTRQDFDNEVITLMMINDENLSHYLSKSLALAGLDPSSVDLADPAFLESNRMYAVNGLVYNNLDPILLEQGTRVRWYLLGLGGEIDLHTVHWHGATVLLGGHRLDTVELLPGTFRTVDMVPDNPGQWLFHCHVSTHMMAGMSAFYQIQSQNGEEW